MCPDAGNCLFILCRFTSMYIQLIQAIEPVLWVWFPEPSLEPFQRREGTFTAAWADCYGCEIYSTCSLCLDRIRSFLLQSSVLMCWNFSHDRQIYLDFTSIFSILVSGNACMGDESNVPLTRAQCCPIYECCKTWNKKIEG